MAAGAFLLVRPILLRLVPPFRVLVAALAVGLAAPAAALAGEEEISALYADLSVPQPTTEAVVVCHGIGCQYQTEIVLSAADRLRLSTLMAPGRASGTFERRAVATAIAWWDRRIGPVAGTTLRVEHAGLGETGDPGQMDSVDTSTNNTSLFLVLDALKLLRYHQVEAPAARAENPDNALPHAAAALTEISGGRTWVFDNWTQNYGEMPDVEPLDTWQGDRN